MSAATCTCGEFPHLQACAVEREQRARSDAKLRRAIQAMEDRAKGKRRWSGAAQALRWMCAVKSSRASPRALQFRRDSSGPPSAEAIEATDRALAAVYGAVKDATLDDQRRHPEKPARFEVWIPMAYLGAGRVRGFSDAQIAERSNGWTEAEVHARMARMLRVVRDHLRGEGMLER